MRKFKKMTIGEFEEYIRQFKFTRDIKEFHVHHTWKPNHATLRKAKSYEAVIYSMYKYHVETRKWSDIGQNITIDDNGDVWLCRDFNIAPASIKGRNSNGFACELIGDFDKGNDVLNGKQLDSLIRSIRVIAEVCRFKTDNKGVLFHSEYSDKTCPGTSVDKDWLLELINKEMNDEMVEKNQIKLNILDNKTEVEGIFINGRNYVSIRELLEKLGFVVDWNQEEQMIDVSFKLK